MTDQLLIENLLLEALVGVHPHEKRIHQRIRLDLELTVDAARAAATDRLADALDYVAVRERLAMCVADSRFALIETLAEHCAQVLLDQFPIRAVTLTIRKPAALPGATVVGVKITRGDVT